MADYGEPYSGADLSDRGPDDVSRFTVDRDGRAVFRMVDGPRDRFGEWRTWEEHERIRLRVERCVNFLAGIPDDWLTPGAAALVRALVAREAAMSGRDAGGTPDG